LLWVGSGRCEKFLRNFLARTFALIVRFRTILHIVSCRTEMVSNVAKRYNMHQYMSLESNSVDRLRSFGKITMRLHGTKVCINCSSSARSTPSFVVQSNYPKSTKMVQNKPKYEFRDQWCGSGSFFAKNYNAT
jgi:hypothetical protein